MGKLELKDKVQLLEFVKATKEVHREKMNDVLQFVFAKYIQHIFSVAVKLL